MASLPITYRPEASIELDEAIEWYARRDERAANRLHDTVCDKLTAAARSLRRWSLEKDGARHIYVASFPYLLIVREIRETLEVVAVAHTSRRSRYWRKRLRKS